MSTGIVPKANDVAQTQRDEKRARQRERNDDIFKVKSDCGEIETDFSSFSDEVDVAGSLCRPSSVEFFKKLGAPPYVVDTLTHGHYPQLTDEVPQYDKRNNNSYYEHKEFADGEVLKLIKKGRVEIVKEKPFIVNPLSVAVQRTKLRLILDCSYLNSFVSVPRFKYEDVKDGINYFRKDYYLFKWDLRDGYHQISIHPDFQKYLGFRIHHEGKEVFCQYKVSPFGLKDMPYLYTKIFRVLVRHWRSIGLSTIKYLDDGICFSRTEEEGLEASKHIRSDLWKAGAFWSVKKSLWVPTKQLEWLGVVWDTRDLSIAGAPHRVQKIKDSTSLLISSDKVKVKSLASFTGQIVSLMEIVGNCCRLTTRCSQMAIASAPHWDAWVGISPSILEELKFWNANIDRLNKKCFLTEKPPVFLNVIASDASNSGCGSLLNNEDTKALRLFSDEEKGKHSTYRELVAVWHALESFLSKISFSKVKMLVDNQSAARIIDVGSMKPDIHKIAMDIFFLCIENGITLEVEWIPREMNEAADSASRLADMVDTDDWQITSEFFSILNNRWGPITIDCFANYYNKKLPRFFSLFNSKGAEGVDAFSFNWCKETCLLVPPVSVAGRALRHLELCKARGILVVPFWPSAHFWPMLINEMSAYITDCIQVKGKNVLMHGMNTNSILGSNSYTGDMLALLIDCSY